MTENSRVLLYQPRIDFRPYYPCFWAPLSLLSIAAPLVDKGYKVEIIDGNLEGSNDSNQGVPPNLDGVLFVGISAMIGGNQIVSAMNFAKNVKAINPDVPVIIGGPAATVIPKQLIECDYFDAVVRGQGELPITMIAEAMSDDASISGITGVVTRDHLDVQIPPLQDKSIFPPYPWELVDVSAYLRNDPYTGGRTLNYVSSQGCPYKCGYCSESFTCRSKWTGLSAERIFAEVSDLVKANNLTGIKFYDSNFFANIRRTRRFAELIIESGLQVNWSASAHPKDLIRIANDMPLLKKSGLSRLLIGAESGYQPVLDYVQKGTQAEDNLTVARICAKNQVAVSFTYIVGFPGIKGDIDIPLDLQNKLDFVMAGLHARTDYAGRDTEKNTQAVISAVKNNKIKIITHPYRPGFPIDIPKVVEACAENKVALELNIESLKVNRDNSEFITEIKKLLNEVAKSKGNLVISSDSHYELEIGDDSIIKELNIEIPEGILLKSKEQIMEFLGV